MGAHPYWYTVPYAGDVQMALEALREREFKAGRYNPVMRFINFPITPTSPAPGPKHASPDDAMEAAAEEGTRSILDIQSVGDEPDFCSARPLSEAELQQDFGTTQPTREHVDNCDMQFLEDLERGHAIYFLIYEDGQPVEVFFAGYSFD